MEFSNSIGKERGKRSGSSLRLKTSSRQIKEEGKI